MALACAPLIESMTCQLDLPTQNGRMDRSLAELSIGTSPYSKKVLRYFSWFMLYCKPPFVFSLSTVLRPQVPWGQQIPAQTRTRFNCQKTGSAGLSTAEGQPPVYPAGGLSIPLAARVSKPCFKKWQEQGLVWCCLFAAYIARLPCFSSKFFCITYLTSYHWTFLHRKRADQGENISVQTPLSALSYFISRIITGVFYLVKNFLLFFWLLFSCTAEEKP